MDEASGRARDDRDCRPGGGCRQGQWRYEPATRDSEPMDVSFTIVIEFQLDNDDLAWQRLAWM